MKTWWNAVVSQQENTYHLITPTCSFQTPSYFVIFFVCSVMGKNNYTASESWIRPVLSSVERNPSKIFMSSVCTWLVLVSGNQVTKCRLSS
jgi:hypothetical protein